MTTKVKLFFLLRNKKNFQKLLPKLVFYVYSFKLRKHWLRRKIFAILYDVEKFKRKRIRAARYPTKPWMRGAEYFRFKRRYQTFLVSDSRRFSRVVNKSLNSLNMLTRQTDLKYLTEYSSTVNPYDYFQGLLR